MGATKPEVKHEWRTAVVNGECENQPIVYITHVLDGKCAIQAGIPSVNKTLIGSFAV
jgi:hypothetical protein